MLDSLLDLLSDSSWSYLVVLAISAVDAFFPVVPAETAVITGGVLAAAGDLNVVGIIVLAAAGALAGDHVSYVAGRTLGVRARRRFLGGASLAARIEWAETQLAERGGSLLLVARFVPGGRTAATFTSGMLAMPWRRFLAFDLIAVSVWAGYAGMLGFIGGQAFEDQPLTAVVVALAAALSLTAAFELVRHRRRGRALPPAPAARSEARA